MTPGERSSTAIKVAFLAAGIILVGNIARYLAYLSVSGDGSFVGYVEGLCRFDCGWFYRIAEHGYSRSVGPPPGWTNWAFFPAMPMLARWLGHLLDVPVVMAGFILSTLCSAVAVALGYRLLGRNLRTTALFGILVFAGPLSFYFSTLYTEALYMAAGLGAMVLAAERRYILAALLGALMSATRSVGFLFTIYLAILIVQFELWQHPARMWAKRILDNPQWVLAIGIVPLGLAGYMLFLHLWMGDALAFVHIQRAWGREFQNPFRQAIMIVQGGGYSLFLLGLLLAGLGLCLFMIRKGKLADAAFSALSILMPFLNGIESMQRYVIGTPPLSVEAARLLGRGRIVAYLLMAAMVLSGFILSRFWFHGMGQLV